MLGKKNFPLDTTNGSPLYCATLLAGVIFLGLCTDLGDFSCLVPHGGFFFVVLFLPRSKHLGTQRHSIRNTAVFKELSPVSSVPWSSLSLVVVVSIIDSLAVLALASAMIQPQARCSTWNCAILYWILTNYAQNILVCLVLKIMLSIFSTGLLRVSQGYDNQHKILKNHLNGQFRLLCLS